MSRVVVLGAGLTGLSAAVHLQRAEDHLAELQRMRAAGEQVQVRDRARYSEHDAVRHELNLAIGPTPVVRHEVPRWTDAQIQLMLPASERARTAPSSSIGSNIPRTKDSPAAPGVPRQQFATERRLRQDTLTVYFEACPICKQYPNDYEAKT